MCIPSLTGMFSSRMELSMSARLLQFDSIEDDGMDAGVGSSSSAEAEAAMHCVPHFAIDHTIMIDA